jgi:hypothetical protein
MNSEKNMHKTEKFSKFLLQKINLSYNIQFKKLKPLGRVVNFKKIILLSLNDSLSKTCDKVVYYILVHTNQDLNWTRFSFVVD